MPEMNMKIKLEIAKILTLEFECSSSVKKKEEQADEKKEPSAPTTPSK